MLSRRITFSRRKLLVGSAAAIALPSLGLYRASADDTAPIGSGLSASDREVSMLSASDSAFADRVGRLYPGLIGDPHYQMLSPLTVLVTVEKGPALRAFTTSWSITTANGTYETPLFHYAEPFSRRRKGNGLTVVSAQTNLLREGESLLITPFFVMSPVRYQKLGSSWYHLVKPKEPAGFLASQLSAATSVKVSLDAAIFEDRKVAGQDKHHLAVRLRARRNAEHDEAHAVMKLLTSNAADADVAAMLSSHSNAARSSAPKANGWYLNARKFHAQLLLELQQSAQDRQTFTKMVLRMSRLHRTNLSRLTT
jgi:hypothetical protein